jgi:competence protein ComEC
VKASFLDAIQRIIPDPESSLLGGILLGVKQSLGDDLEQAFIDTGTIHIVVLSGYNVTIVSEAIVKLFQSIFSERLALVFGSLGIGMFALVTGLGTTTVRASIMGLLGLLARVTGRTYDIVRALFLAGFGMVMYNPMTLAFDVSFQLSFIATLGLIMITPIVESWRLVRYIPTWIGLRSIVASTLATQIAVLPYMLYKIGTVSIVSPLANLLVLPVIPLTMGISFGAGLLEMIASFGGQPFSWFSFLLLHYVLILILYFHLISIDTLLEPLSLLLLICYIRSFYVDTYHLIDDTFLSIFHEIPEFLINCLYLLCLKFYHLLIQHQPQLRYFFQIAQLTAL